MPLNLPEITPGKDVWGQQNNDNLTYLDEKPGIKGDKGDKGNAGAAGGTDAATAVWVQDGPLTSAALSAKIASQVPATRVQAWGHSYMAGVGIGMTAGVNDMATLIAAERDLPLRNKAVGGTTLFHSLSADANWTSIMREVKRPTKFEPLTGLYPTMYGINDINNLGNTLTKMAPYLAALRVCISRFRSGGFFPDADPSVTLGGPGTWGTAVETPYPGVRTRYNATAGGTVTITTGPDFPGGFVVPLFISWVDAGGATFTGSGDAAGRSVNTTAIGRTGSRDVTCIRIPADPGENTFTFTSSNIVGGVGAAFIGWQWEPEGAGPMVPLILQPKPLDYTNYGAGGPDGIPTDATVDIINTATIALAAEFNDRVFTVDTSVMNKSSTYFIAGNIHPTVAGHAKIAELTETAIAAHGTTPPIPTDVADITPTVAAVAAPSWKTYVPVLAGTGTTQGNAGMVGYYYESSPGLVHFWARAALDTTSVIGSTVTLSLPQPEVSQNAHSTLSAWCQDAGVGSYQLAADVGGGANLGLVRLYTLGTAGKATAINSTSPFTWTAGDYIEIHGVIQTAAAV